MADPISASVLLGAGGGIKGLSAIMQFNEIQAQKDQVDNQAKIAMKQNQAGANVVSVNNLREANDEYDKGLAKAASSGAGLSSGSFANNATSTYNNESNKEFINQANLNVANLNALFGAQQRQQQLQSMQTGLVLGLAGDIVSGAGSMMSSTFTGGTSSKMSGKGIQQPKSNLSLFNMES